MVERWVVDGRSMRCLNQTKQACVCAMIDQTTNIKLQITITRGTHAQAHAGRGERCEVEVGGEWRMWVAEVSGGGGWWRWVLEVCGGGGWWR